VLPLSLAAWCCAELVGASKGANRAGLCGIEEEVQQGTSKILNERIIANSLTDKRERNWDCERVTAYTEVIT
jgi:hypothetical protein